MKNETLLITILALAGCASPVAYQPATSDLLGSVVGYAEEKLAENTYRLTYAAGLNGRQVEALAAWMRRADELCPSGYLRKEGPKINLNTREFIAIYGGGVYASKESNQRPFVYGIIVCN